ncbi:hypothetical protein V490_07397 [Pseudogymnoascus sp. VKM F-3557]|nr:hypothetical protein V490_07397 [Pseudogymnoascus sp. VKM F-3557]
MASKESYAIKVGERILVTGANSFVGSNVVDLLLSLGYLVRGTIRSEKPWLEELFESKYGAGRFELAIVPKLDDIEALAVALIGVSGVVHVASDVTFGTDPNKIIHSVVAATEAILKASSEVSSVKRVVLTSSSAAATILEEGQGSRVVDQDTWNDAAIKAAWDENTPADSKALMIYAASKTEGERAAFNWVKKNKPGFVFNSIGEVLHPNIGSTGRLTVQLLEGNEAIMNLIVAQYFIDAKDLARLHAIALLDPSVQHERLLGLAVPYTWKEVIDTLRELRPSSEKLVRNVPAAREGYVQLLPINRSEELLRSFFGQSSWTNLRDSLNAGSLVKMTETEKIVGRDATGKTVVSPTSEDHHGYTKEITPRDMLVSAAIVLTQLVQMIPYGSGINAGLEIGRRLGATPAESTWIVASYPLTQGAFVLIGGRLGAVYGHKNTVVVAGVLWVIFHLVSGFMKSVITLSLMRGLSGIGGALIVPNAIALLTITFPPGKMRNISVGFFGATAPIGATLGSLLSGLFVQLLPWKWLFFFLAILGAVTFTLFAFVVPGEAEPFDKGGSIDYVGSYFGVGGLVLFNFVWNQAPVVGWKEPYEYALLIVATLHLVAFAIWESKFTKNPILPLDIWSVPSFGIMILSSFSAFMSVGIVIWYISIWNLEVRHYTLLSNAAAFATLGVCGVAAAIISAKVIRYAPAEHIMAVGALASGVALILIATMPEQQVYWAQVFPALIFAAFGPDFLFTAAQIIASNTVKRHQQGVAGSLIGTLLSYGLSTGLGFAGTVEAYTNNKGNNVVQGYRNALYLGVGLAGISMVLAMLFIRIPKDQRDGWDEGEVDDVPSTTPSNV